MGYALLGAGWLMVKTEGPVAERARHHALLLLGGLLLFIAVVSIWTPLQESRIAARWFSYPNILFLWPVPFVTALLAFGCYKSIRSGRKLLPFMLTIGLFMLAYTGLAISKFPYLVPPVEGAEGLTVWQTAAAPESQIFVLIGVLILLPVILTYTVLSYWSFRGKVRLGEGYH